MQNREALLVAEKSSEFQCGLYCAWRHADRASPKYSNQGIERDRYQENLARGSGPFNNENAYLPTYYTEDVRN